ncbi:MAG: YceD family protein [Gammaproteobacteria bacterium]
MSDGLPEHVEIARLAARSARIQSVTPVSAMARLVELLVDATGSVDSDLRFSERQWIDGEASARVRVICQRCLEPMAVAIDVPIRLAVDAELASLPDDREAVMSDDGRISLLALVEDELILALPIVPMHAEEKCIVRSVDKSAPAERESPFAVLQQLKNRPH